MKTIANRLIVIAASTIAFGAVAFGQTHLTAEIPFAFHTVSGTLPAGNYEVSETAVGAATHIMLLRNTASQKTAFAGSPTINPNGKADNAPVLQFACSERGCSLKAIKTSSVAYEYLVPKTKEDSSKVAVVSIVLKPVNAD